MDSGRFDAWTRRHFGLAASGVISGLLGLGVHPAGSDAKKRNKKRRRRKRCLKLGNFCTSGGKRRCCKRLRCDFPSAGSMATLCCRTEGGQCDAGIDCCEPFTCNLGNRRCEEL
jgi:hypothetical protein